MTFADLLPGESVFVDANTLVYHFEPHPTIIKQSSLPRRPLVSLTVEAIYEQGILKPVQPLPLAEHETVRLTIEPALTWAERTAGMLKWTGDPEILRRVAEDDEFGLLELPIA